MFRKKSECEKQFLKRNRLNYGLTLLSLVLMAALSILLAFLLQIFIEAVELGSTGRLRLGGQIFLVFILLYGGFSLLQRNFKNAYMRKALSQFKDYVFQKMLDKSIAQFENGMSSKFISAFSNDLNSIEINYLGGTLELIVTVLMFVGAAAAMLVLEWRLALPVLAVSAVCVFLSLKYGRKLVEKENATSEENMGFVAQVKDLLTGFIVIKSFKAEKEVLDIF